MAALPIENADQPFLMSGILIVAYRRDSGLVLGFCQIGYLRLVLATSARLIQLIISDNTA
jgi:hypothetical protein